MVPQQVLNVVDVGGSAVCLGNLSLWLSILKGKKKNSLLSVSDGFLLSLHYMLLAKVRLYLYLATELLKTTTRFLLSPLILEQI